MTLEVAGRYQCCDGNWYWCGVDSIAPEPTATDFVVVLERLQAAVDLHKADTQGDVNYCRIDGFVWPCKTVRVARGET